MIFLAKNKKPSRERGGHREREREREKERRLKKMAKLGST
jgi:hypothetical protein